MPFESSGCKKRLLAFKLAQDKNQDVTMIHSSKTVIVFIVLTGVLGTAVLLTMIKRALRASPPATVQRDVWVGDILPTLPNYSWGEHDHSLVLAVQVDCLHCKASVPFYRRLQSMVAATTKRVGVISVFPNPPDKVRAFLEQFDLDMPAVP